MVIIGNQGQSRAIIGNQGQSRAIIGNQGQSLRAGPSPSVVIRNRDVWPPPTGLPHLSEGRLQQMLLVDALELHLGEHGRRRQLEPGEP